MALDKIYLTKINEVFMRANASASVAREMSEHFSFMTPNARFDPRVKNKFWDGKIRLYNLNTGLIYIGLLHAVQEFAYSNNYEVEIDPALVPVGNPPDRVIKTTKSPRDYQLETYEYAIKNERGCFLSPTSSGKSLMIYMIGGYYKKKTLIVVPSVNLVLQMRSDFEEYAGKPLDIHCITAGVNKQTDCPITISTWQSIYKMPKQWFSQFDVVIGDEIHLFKATSLKGIMEKLENCKYRFGFTGTFDDSLTNKMTIEGLFGHTYQSITAKEMIEKNYSSDLKIKIIVLKHDEQSRLDIHKLRAAKKFTYSDEVKYLSNQERRNTFLSNLVVSFEQNSLILFKNIDHGKTLHNIISNKCDRPVYLIYGGVEGDERERIRNIFNEQSNAIIVASYGTFSTGVNIPNIHNVVFGTPSKSRVRVLQSIGRGLRLHDEKDYLTVYDVADDLRYKQKMNYTLNHMVERTEIYNEQGFNYKIYNVDLN